jgi:hypothetical protein
MELECCLKKKKNKKQINHLFFKWFLCHENMSSILGIHMQIIHEVLFHAADLKFCVGKHVLHPHSPPTELAADLQLVLLWSFLRWLHNLPKHQIYSFSLWCHKSTSHRTTAKMESKTKVLFCLHLLYMGCCRPLLMGLPVSGESY